MDKIPKVEAGLIDGAYVQGPQIALKVAKKVVPDGDYTATDTVFEGASYGATSGMTAGATVGAFLGGPPGAVAGAAVGGALGGGLGAGYAGYRYQEKQMKNKK